MASWWCIVFSEYISLVGWVRLTSGTYYLGHKVGASRSITFIRVYDSGTDHIWIPGTACRLQMVCMKISFRIHLEDDKVCNPSPYCIRIHSSVAAARVRLHTTNWIIRVQVGKSAFAAISVILLLSLKAVQIAVRYCSDAVLVGCSAKSSADLGDVTSWQRSVIRMKMYLSPAPVCVTGLVLSGHCVQ